MKNKDKINKILLYHQNPAEELERYQKETIRREDAKWIIVVFVLMLVFLFTLGYMKPNKRDLIEAARPIVDTMKVRYQEKLDMVVDSLYQEHIKNYRK